MELLEAIQIIKQKYQNDARRVAEEKDTLQKYGNLFHPNNIDNLTAENFKSFLLIKNNKHWEGIHRQGNLITSDMGKLKSTLRLLLDESIPLKERLEKILPKNKPPAVKGLGRAVLTPILFVVYPEKYAVFNSITERGMKEFGIFPNFRNTSFSEKYLKVNEIINKLAKQHGLSLWQIDEVWWLGAKRSLPLEETYLAEEEETFAEGESEEQWLPARMESQLEEFLIGSWERIPEFKNLEILQEDGDYIGQQYDTREVGRIDLLCKDKKTGDFVVVELKKGRESDKVVGQVLRYIGWVKKNLAASGQKVYGVIITFEGDPDSKLKYSLEPIKDFVRLKFYKIKITIS